MKTDITSRQNKVTTPPTQWRHHLICVVIGVPAKSTPPRQKVRPAKPRKESGFQCLELPCWAIPTLCRGMQTQEKPKSLDSLHFAFYAAISTSQMLHVAPLDGAGGFPSMAVLSPCCLSMVSFAAWSRVTFYKICALIPLRPSPGRGSPTDSPCCYLGACNLWGLSLKRHKVSVERMDIDG